MAERTDDRNKASSAGSDASEETVLEQLRSSARYAGALTKHDPGWFGRLLEERLVRAGGKRPDWGLIYPGLSIRERARRRIASASRRASLGGGLCATGAQLGELATAWGGLGASVGVPHALAVVAIQTVYCASVQVDVACDVASIYGVPFDVGDKGELATVFDVALRGPMRKKAARGHFDLARIVAPNDAELLRRVGRHFAKEAVVGLVPFLGVPSSATAEYLDTRRLGNKAWEYARRRHAVRAVLGTTLDRPGLQMAVLLEGAWLLAIATDVLTHEGLLVLSALAAMIPPRERAPLAKLRSVGEAVWIVHMGMLEDEQAREVLSVLEDIAGLLGPLVEPERSFLERAGAALGQPIDFARIARVHERITRGETDQ